MGNQYGGTDMHRRMVADRPRTDCFHASITATVQPGDVVLDVGAGSGILSLFAAAAGASCVYAVEREPTAAALATRLVKDNGLDGVVQVLVGEIERISLPEQVDVIVSEWLGVYGVDENFLPPVILARDRWLKPGGTMIPGAVTAWIAPVSHPAAAEAVALHDRPYGLDLTGLAAHDPNQLLWLPGGVAEADLCAEPVELWTVDPASIRLEEAVRPFAAQPTVRFTAGGVNGLTAWFTADMPAGPPLSTAPGAPLTHWGHFLFPVVSMDEAGEGDEVEFGFHSVPAPAGGSNHLWSVHADGSVVESHDTRRLVRAPEEPPWRVVESAHSPPRSPGS